MQGVWRQSISLHSCDQTTAISKNQMVCGQVSLVLVTCIPREEESKRVRQCWGMRYRPDECRLSYQRTSADQVWGQQEESSRLVKAESNSHITYLHILFTCLQSSSCHKYYLREGELMLTGRLMRILANGVELRVIEFQRLFNYSFTLHVPRREAPHKIWERLSVLFCHLNVSRSLNYQYKQWSCIELDLCRVNTD